MKLYAGLSIGELAAETGVSVSALRAWERRHGYPVPQRLPSGHRRYDAAEVRVVRDALRLRDDGVPLADALAKAGANAGSVVAAIRDLLPDVEPAALSFRAMLAISRAVEDAVAAAGDRPVLIGSFQRPGAWTASAPRWRALAPSTLATVALAPGLREAALGDRLWTAPLDDHLALAEEWAVIYESPSAAGCVVATERPGGGRRCFDAMWSSDPSVVRIAARRMWQRARPRLDARTCGAVERRLTTTVVRTERTLAASARLANRIVEQLDARP